VGDRILNAAQLPLLAGGERSLESYQFISSFVRIKRAVAFDAIKFQLNLLEFKFYS
jgi:hypothetical protein